MIAASWVKIFTNAKVRITADLTHIKNMSYTMMNMMEDPQDKTVLGL